MPKVSVIIPVYNTAEYMDKCVESVLEQTFEDIEVLLVDDGSTDGKSPEKCDEYARKDKRVRVIHKENGGLTSAWIAGLTEACADYVAFVDSDDWVDTDMIEKLFGHVSSSFAESEIIAGNYVVEKARERRNETQTLEPGEYTGAALEDVRKNLLGSEIRPVTMSRCMKIISRKLVLENIKYCDPTITMGEDVNIMLPCLCDCRRLVILKDSYFYHYRLVADSMAHGYNPKILANLELTDRTFRDILREKKILNADHQMDREFVVMLLIILKIVLRSTGDNTTRMVKDIFLREDIRQKILSTEVTLRGRANRLLYFCARHPSGPVIAFTRGILAHYDRKTN